MQTACFFHLSLSYYLFSNLILALNAPLCTQQLDAEAGILQTLLFLCRLTPCLVLPKRGRRWGHSFLFSSHPGSVGSPSLHSKVTVFCRSSSGIQIIIGVNLTEPGLLVPPSHAPVPVWDPPPQTPRCQVPGTLLHLRGTRSAKSSPQRSKCHSVELLLLLQAPRCSQLQPLLFAATVLGAGVLAMLPL